METTIKRIIKGSIVVGVIDDKLLHIMPAEALSCKPQP